MVQMLTAYSEGRANINDVMRALVSHRGWFVPIVLFAQSGGENRRVDNILMLGAETLVPQGELWVFTDKEAAIHAQAQGVSLGSYAGGMAGTELFQVISPDSQTVRVNPGSPSEHTWVFMKGSASAAGGLWAEAVALEESFIEWQQAGRPDKEALMNYRAFVLYDHVSGPVITLPNQAGMSNPAAAFTAPDCADAFLSKLSDEQRMSMRQVTIDGRSLLESPPQGIDGLLFNPFGPGTTFALPFDSLRSE